MARKDALKKMREILVQRRDALRMALDGDFSLLNQLRNQKGGDVVDFAIDSAQDEISSQLAEVESRELSRIERALKRLDNGTYGKCEVCGVNIPLARIQALPFATTCIKCQRESEQSSGSEGATNWGNLVNGQVDDTRFNDVDLNMS